MKKLEKKNGFTLVEMLACVVTLLLMLGIVASGTNFALHSYNETMYESNSQMLESSINMYLTDILRHAKDIKTADGESAEELDVIGFTSSSYRIYGGTIGIRSMEDGSGPYLVYITENDNAVMIVGENMYANTLYISDLTLKYNKEKGYFTGTYTIQSTILEDAVRVCGFTCRTIAEF